MRIFVTGATGFLGKHLIERLSAERSGWAISALVRPGGTPPPSCEPQSGDLSALTGLIPEGTDAVVHLAAIGHPKGWTDFDQTIDANVAGTARVMEEAHRRSVAHVIHVSTTSVFTFLEDLEDAYDDDDTRYVVPPVGFYNLTKRWAEELAVQYRVRLPAVTIFRPGLVYGVRDVGELGRFQDKIRAGEPIGLYGDGRTVLSPVHIDDVLNALIACLEQPKHWTVNVVGDDRVSLERAHRDLAERMDVPVTFEPGPRPPVSVAGRAKRVRELVPGWSPVTWAEGLARMFEGDG